MKKTDLTTADLIVLALLAESPMHGYQVNAELTRREAQDWAEVSRPQVYYSLRKLAKGRWIKTIADAEGSSGPERQICQITASGRAALEEALTQSHWAEQRPPPPFLTWLALSPHAPTATVATMIERRKHFVQGQIEKEQKSLQEILQESGDLTTVARLMVSFTIHQFESELAWLDQVSHTLLKR